MKTKSLLLVALLALASVHLVAQPAYVNYQGTVNDQEGNPLTTGSYIMDFRLYTNLVGNAAPVWGPFRFDGTTGDGHSGKATVTQGRFNVILGPEDMSGRSIQTAFTGDTCYVEIRIDNGSPILPRQQVLSAPYAFEAQNARTVSNLAPMHFLNPPGMIAPFAGAADKVPAGWLLCDGTEYPTTNYPNLYATLGMAWGGKTNVISATEVRYFFRVPDLRGMFLRGLNGTRNDGWGDPEASTRANAVPSASLGNSGNNVGSLQGDMVASHKHPLPKTIYVHYRSFSGDSGADKPLKDTGDFYMSETSNTGGVETRAKNAAVNFIIKY